MIAVADGDRALARAVADELGERMWDDPRRLFVPCPGPRRRCAEAIAARRESRCVLVDLGDNIGGGSAGDGTVLLREILRQRADGAVVVLYDPEAVADARQVGPGGILSPSSRRPGRSAARRAGRGPRRRPLAPRRQVGRGPAPARRPAVQRPGSDGRHRPRRRKRLVLELAAHARRSASASSPAWASTRRGSRSWSSRRPSPTRPPTRPIAGEVIEVDTPGLTAIDPRGSPISTAGGRCIRWNRESRPDHRRSPDEGSQPRGREEDPSESEAGCIRRRRTAAMAKLARFRPASGSIEPARNSLLSREELRWYARFCFDQGLTEHGIDAYERLVEGNAAAEWIYEQEAASYLAAVRAVRGAIGMVEAFDRFPRGDGPMYPDLQLLVADAEVEIKRSEEALARIRAVTNRHHDAGRCHAALARHAFACGNLDESRRHFLAAARRGVTLTDGLDLQRLGISADDLTMLAAASKPPSMELSLSEFCRNPGLTLLPSSKPSPHVFGGEEFEMAHCPGCNRPISLVASLDATSEPLLAPFAATLPKLPIPHCRHCALMFLEPDYRVSDDGRRIEVFNVKPSRGPMNAFEVSGPIVRQFGKLAEPKRSRSTDPVKAVELLEKQRHSGPQVCGAPQWINEPRRRFCPRCDQEQLFYAAASETEAFDTHVVFNPDGYIYFFACPGCRIISTSVDNS